MQPSGSSPADSARVYFGALDALFATPSLHTVLARTEISKIPPPSLFLPQTQNAPADRIKRWLAQPEGRLVHDNIYRECQELTAAENLEVVSHAVEMMSGRLNQLTSHVRLLCVIQDNLDILFKKPKMGDIKFTQLPILDLEMHPPLALYQNLHRLVEALATGGVAIDALPLFTLSTWQHWLTCLKGYVDATITCVPGAPAPLATLSVPTLIGELWNQKSVLRLTVMRCPFAIYALSPTECTYCTHLTLYSVPFEQNVHHAFGYQKYVDLIELSPGAQREFNTHAEPLIKLLKAYRQKFIDYIVFSANLIKIAETKKAVDKFPAELRTEVQFELIRDAEFLFWIGGETVLDDLAQFPKKDTPEFNRLLELLPYDQRLNFELIQKQLDLGLCKDEAGEMFYMLRFMAKVKGIQALARDLP